MSPKYTHPTTGMIYIKYDGAFYFKTTDRRCYMGDRVVYRMSGALGGFIPYKENV